MLEYQYFNSQPCHPPHAYFLVRRESFTVSAADWRPSPRPTPSCSSCELGRGRRFAFCGCYVASPARRSSVMHIVVWGVVDLLSLQALQALESLFSRRLLCIMTLPILSQMMCHLFLLPTLANCKLSHDSTFLVLATSSAIGTIGSGQLLALGRTPFHGCWTVSRCSSSDDGDPLLGRLITVVGGLDVPLVGL